MAEPSNPTPQETEFKLWGITTGELRRGTLMAIMGLLVSTIAYMKFDADRRETRLMAEIAALQRQIIECEQKSAQTINNLRVEQIAMINEMIQKADAARARVERIQKRIK